MPTNSSLQSQAKMYIAMVLVFLGLPCVALGSFMIFNQNIENTQESLAERAPLVVQLIENDILAKLQALQHAAMLLSAERIDQITQHQLDGIVQGFSGVIWAGVTDDAGKVMFAYQNLLKDVNVSSRPWFKEGLNQPSVLDRHDAVLLAKLLPKREDPYRFIDIAVPIPSTKGDTLGVLALHLDWIWYQKQFPGLIGVSNTGESISYAVFGKDKTLRLLKASESDGDLITHTDFSQGIDEKLKERFYFVKQTGHVDGVLQSLDWTLYIIQNKKVVHANVMSSALFGMLIFLVGLAASSCVFLSLAHRLSQRSRAYVNALLGSNPGDLSKLRMQLPMEVLPLSNTAENLISNLQDQKTELQAALKDAHNSHMEIQSLIAQAPVPMAMFDRDMRYMVCSNLWQSICFPDTPDPVGQSHYDLMPDLPEHWKSAHQMGLLGNTIGKCDDEWTDPAGNIGWIDWTVQPWINNEGKVGGLIIITKDVTEAKLAKIALAKSEERFQLAMLGSHDGLWDWNVETDEIYYSPSWKTMLGYQPWELEASFETWERLMHPDDLENAKAAFWNAMQDPQKTYYTNSFRLAHKDGRWLSVFSRGLIIRDENGKATRTVGTHLDRTEIESMQTELDKAWILAQAESSSNEAKSRFLATVSHEIRNPLNSVCGFARLIEEEVHEPEVKHHAQLLHRTTDSLKMILNDLLDFAKIEAGRLEIQNEPFDLAALLQELAQCGQMLCDEKTVTFRYTSHWNESTLFIGDAGRIRQVLQNLLTNAIKFTTQGEVSLSVNTKALNPGNEQITVQVSDTGIGMTDAQVQQLFKPFNQVHKNQGVQYGGTGLGLSIVKSLTELMQGQIQCQSVPDEGSSFTLVFKLNTCPASQLKQLKKTQAGVLRTVLVADDSPLNLKVMTTFLSKRGHHVVSAKDGQEALEKLQAHEFDYVFLDMDMPGHSGLQVVSQIKSNPGHNDQAQFACLSGHADLISTQTALVGGFDRYFAKPVDLDELLNYMR